MRSAVIFRRQVVRGLAGRRAVNAIGADFRGAAKCLNRQGDQCDVVADGRSLVTSVGMHEESVWLHDSKGDRRISFEGNAFLPGIGAVSGGGRSVFSPDGEKLFIDAVKHFRPQLEGKLLDDVQGFIAQEGIHAREHAQLNQMVDRNRYPVAEIEEAVRGRIALSRERGPMGMLLSTIALEHFTAMMAEMHMANPEIFASTPPHIERR